MRDLIVIVPDHCLSFCFDVFLGESYYSIDLLALWLNVHTIQEHLSANLKGFQKLIQKLRGACFWLNTLPEEHLEFVRKLKTNKLINK